MRIKQPEVNKTLENAVPFFEALSLTQAFDSQLEGYAFSSENVGGFNLEKIECRNCIFENLIFTSAILTAASFKNVVFRHCDFSGVSAMDISFNQCLFDGCKLMGANFAAGSLNDVKMENCQGDGLVFSESLIKNVAFEHCSLKRSVFSDLHQKSLYEYNECDLRVAEFCNISLKNINFTTCDIDGIVISDGALKGARVTPLQACELAKLLGVIIVD